MPELTVTRRAYLLAAIQADPLTPWTTHRAATEVYAPSPYGHHRNTARKDLRALAGRGVLLPQDAGGRRTYLFNSQTGDAR